MSRLLRLTLVGLLITGALLVVPGVIAQEAPAPSAAVIQKERLDAEIEALSQTYRGQLNEYRLAEREFQIARDQYRQLQTLASINQVTEAARKVLQLRNQVISTYFELLRIRLVAAEGIDLELKASAVKRLEEQRTWLQENKEELVAASDREEFNALADQFGEQIETLTAVSQEATAILAVGQLQAVFDKLSLLADDVRPLEASQSTAATSRSMRETTAMVGQLRTQFQTTWGELERALRDERIDFFSTNLTDTLNPAYANLNRLAAFLEELIKAL